MSFSSCTKASSHQYCQYFDFIAYQGFRQKFVKTRRGLPIGWVENSTVNGVGLIVCLLDQQEEVLIWDW